MATLLPRADTAPIVADASYAVGPPRPDQRADRAARESGIVDIVKLETEVASAKFPFHRGDFYVPLDQPLANVVVAALEPEPQSSYASNRLLAIARPEGLTAFLPLYRIAAPLHAAATVWDGK
jgi:hypothetical protein